MSNSLTLKDKQAHCLLAGSRGDHLSHDSWRYRLSDGLHLLWTQPPLRAAAAFCLRRRSSAPTSPTSWSSNNRRRNSAPPRCAKNNLIFEYILMSRNVCPRRQLLNCMVFKTDNSRLLVLPNSALVAGKDHFHHRAPPKPLPLASSCWKVGSIKSLS